VGRVRSRAVDATLAILRTGRVAQRIGTAVADAAKVVRIPQRGSSPAQEVLARGSRAPRRLTARRSRVSTSFDAYARAIRVRRGWPRRPAGRNERAPMTAEHLIAEDFLRGREHDSMCRPTLKD